MDCGIVVWGCGREDSILMPWFWFYVATYGRRTVIMRAGTRSFVNGKMGDFALVNSTD